MDGWMDSHSDNSHSVLQREIQRKKRRREIDQRRCVYNWVLKVNRGQIQMNQNMMHAYSTSLGTRLALCTSLHVCLTKNVCCVLALFILVIYTLSCHIYQEFKLESPAHSLQHHSWYLQWQTSDVWNHANLHFLSEWWVCQHLMESAKEV